MNNSEEKKELILSFFRKDQDDYWKTLEEVAKGTKISPALVSEIITTSGDFVRSSYREKMGEPLFTSREMFRDKAPFVDKVIGAFKNRID